MEAHLRRRRQRAHGEDLARRTGSDTASLATPASTVKSYDVASRLASVVNGSGFKTAYARGLTGRETGVRVALISYTGQRFDVVASPNFISAS